MTLAQVSTVLMAAATSPTETSTDSQPAHGQDIQGHDGVLELVGGHYRPEAPHSGVDPHYQADDENH